jgi:FkbM family methyltransferase
MRPAYEILLDLVTLGRGFTRTVNGADTFYVNPRVRGLFPESYEPAVWLYLRAHIQPGDIILNAGAHVGLYALGAAVWSAPNGRVIAFEPNPKTRKILTGHVRRNRLSDRVEVLEAAVGAREGEAEFVAEPLAGTSRLGLQNPHSRVPATIARVHVTTIDAVCRERAIAPHWIIMDIEGYEADALQGARAVLDAPSPPEIVAEFHPDLWSSAGWDQPAFESLLAGLRRFPVPLTGQKNLWTEPGVVLLAREGP